MIDIHIDKKSNYSVYVKINFKDMETNIFYTNILSEYCSRKKIELTPITAKWSNNSLISKLFKKKPQFNVYIYPRTYESQFGILKLLLVGNLYKFNNEEETNIFINSAKKIIEDFVNNDFKKFMKPNLDSFYKWDMNIDERKEIIDKIYNS